MSWTDPKFTPEIIDQIPYWVQAGMNREQMASLVGVTVQVFSVCCSRLQISLKQARYPPGSAPTFMPIKPDTKNALIEAGARWHLRGDQLGAWLLDLIVRDNMINAIIDSDEKPPPE